MKWWQSALITILISVLTTLITIFINAIINKNKKLRFLIENEFLSKEGLLLIGLVIYNPSKKPQIYKNLSIFGYKNAKKICEQHCQTSDKSVKNNLGEIQCFLAKPSTVSPLNMEFIRISCLDNRFLDCDKIAISYKNNKNKLIQSILYNSIDKITELINANTKINF